MRDHAVTETTFSLIYPSSGPFIFLAETLTTEYGFQQHQTYLMPRAWRQTEPQYGSAGCIVRANSQFAIQGSKHKQAEAKMSFQPQYVATKIQIWKQAF